ncbi:DUF6925 family protein [Bradyrhizobium sp.]|uniref:DUF6925 family protein n=1 Tax=Bradyrhizobium sp. TaxID=376 RepID=UPI002DF984E7|nr:hypothetical protein [Bradyrhizobium sp.]
MPISSAAIDLLHEQIADADTHWSLGTFGGIAEFSRGRDEEVRLTQSATGAAAVTTRGGIAIELSESCRPFAFECITRSSWSQRVAFCLPAGDCAMNRRTVLTELDADREALQPEYCGSILFDLGLGALQADLCVRIDDHDTVAQLRRHCGQSVFDPANPAMSLLLQTNPHRVFISRIGRIEVYQRIPPASGKSPDGPHTHVLPKLLKTGRTHAATEPIPEGWIPCAHLYPGHPTSDLGGMESFDTARHNSFQRIIESFGLADGVAIKRRVADAVETEHPPSILAIAHDRHARTNVRIALRQLKAAGMASPILNAWLAAFDHGAVDADEEEEETAFQHPR